MLVTAFLLLLFPPILLRSLRGGFYALHVVLVLAAVYLLWPDYATMIALAPWATVRILLVHLVVINLVIILLYKLDKSAAQKSSPRIPERVLHGFALAGGTPGAFLAARLFRHKTKKQSFRSRATWIALLQITLIIGMATYLL